MKCYCHGQTATCIDRVPIFQHLTAGEKQEVAQITRQKSLAKGELLYGMGDQVHSLFVIHSGLVKLYRLSAAGKEQILRVMEPGDFLGELALFTSSPMQHYAEALQECTMCVMEASRLRELMAKYPSIAFKVLEELSQRLEQTEQLLEEISLHSVERRLAQALLDLSAGSSEIELALSKKDLASQMGMTSETLSRKLSSFEAQGLIEQVGQRRIIIRDRRGLEGVLERG